jgi:hypothetical protein
MEAATLLEIDDTMAVVARSRLRLDQLPWYHVGRIGRARIAARHDAGHMGLEGVGPRFFNPERDGIGQVGLEQVGRHFGRHCSLG